MFDRWSRQRVEPGDSGAGRAIRRWLNRHDWSRVYPVIHDIDYQLKGDRSDTAMTVEQGVECYVR